MEESPWGEWRRGHPITTRGIARILKPFNVTPQKDRNGRFYHRSDLQDAIDRYLSTPPQISVTSVTSVTRVTLDANDHEKIINNHVLHPNETCDAC